jgi:transglutaminase-like putative cysteine protease
MTPYLPVFAAFLFHGVVSGRWLVVPCMVLLLILRRVIIQYKPDYRYLAGIPGGIFGFFNGPLPAGVLPPLPLAVVAGAICGLVVLFVLARKQVEALGSALLLVVISGLAGFEPGLAHGVLVAVLVGSIFQQAGFGRWALWGFLPFVLLSGALGVGLAFLVASTQGIAAGVMVEFFRGELLASGMGNIVTVGAFSHVTPNDRVVLDLSGEVPAYLRASVFEQFDGESWSSGEEETGSISLEGEARQHLRILFRQKFSRHLPGPLGSVSLDGQPARLTETLLVVGEGAWGEQVELGFGATPLFKTPKEELIFLPPALKEALDPFAADILKGEQDPQKAASIISGYLSSNFKYSYITNLRGPNHPLVVLLQEKRSAYCVYFASAMAALLRSQEIPARLVGGFLATETTLSGHVLAREKDAHAWVEVWVPDSGWVAFDPTPLVEEPEVSFIEKLQTELHELLTRWLLSIRRGAVLEAGWPLVGLGVMVGAVFGLRQLGSLRFFREREAELPQSYRRYLSLLKKAGVVIKKGDTEEERLLQLKGVLKEQAAAFIQAWQKHRFGGGKAEELELLLAVFEEGIKKAVHNPR